MKIFHYGAGLHFANRDYFREVLFKITGLDPVKWHKEAMKRMKKERAQMSQAIKEQSETKWFRRRGSLLSVSTATTMTTMTTLRSTSRWRSWLCCAFGRLSSGRRSGMQTPAHYDSDDEGPGAGGQQQQRIDNNNGSSNVEEMGLDNSFPNDFERNRRSLPLHRRRKSSASKVKQK